MVLAQTRILQGRQLLLLLVAYSPLGQVRLLLQVLQVELVHHLQQNIVVGKELLQLHVMQQMEVILVVLAPTVARTARIIQSLMRWQEPSTSWKTPICKDRYAGVLKKEVIICFEPGEE